LLPRNQLALSLKCRISERTAQRCIKEIEELGELVVHRNAGVKGNGGVTNKYQLVDQAAQRW
jgi:hypothetical protein